MYYLTKVGITPGNNLNVFPVKVVKLWASISTGYRAGEEIIYTNKHQGGIFPGVYRDMPILKPSDL